MAEFKNILFFYNPSINQDTALEQVLDLADKNNSSVTLLAVVKPSSDIFGLFDTSDQLDKLTRELVRDTASQLDEVIESLSHHKTKITPTVIIGTPFIEIIREAKRHRHDLVALAADGKHGILSRVFGGTSMHLLRKCPLPVWVINAEHENRRQKVLAAIDVSDAPWEDMADDSLNSAILDHAASLARSRACELHIIQAWSIPYEGYLQIRGNISESSIEQLRIAASRNYRERIDQLVHDIDMTGIVRVKTHLEWSLDPAESIVEACRTLDVDLLVMGTLARSGVSGILIGNTAEEVLGSVENSVLAIKPDSFISPVDID